MSQKYEKSNLSKQSHLECSNVIRQGKSFNNQKQNKNVDFVLDEIIKDLNQKGNKKREIQQPKKHKEDEINLYS